MRGYNGLAEPPYQQIAPLMRFTISRNSPSMTKAGSSPTLISFMGIEVAIASDRIAGRRRLLKTGTASFGLA